MRATESFPMVPGFLPLILQLFTLLGTQHLLKSGLAGWRTSLRSSQSTTKSRLRQVHIRTCTPSTLYSHEIISLTDILEETLTMMKSLIELSGLPQQPRLLFLVSRLRHLQLVLGGFVSECCCVTDLDIDIYSRLDEYGWLG